MASFYALPAGSVICETPAGMNGNGGNYTIMTPAPLVPMPVPPPVFPAQNWRQLQYPASVSGTVIGTGHVMGAQVNIDPTSYGYFVPHQFFNHPVIGRQVVWLGQVHPAMYAPLPNFVPLEAHKVYMYYKEVNGNVGPRDVRNF